MIAHLTFWHSLEPALSRRLVDHPHTPVPEWVRPALDERGGMLEQMPLE